MGIDRRDDDDTPVPVTDRDRAGADRLAADGATVETAGDATVETAGDATIDIPSAQDGRPGPGPDIADDADRAKYHAEYRARVEAVYLSAARDRWEAVKPGFEAEWLERAKQNLSPPDAAPDLDREFRAQVEEGCTETREIEEKTVTPAMRNIEAADPDRQLAGLDFRCKGQERIMEKIAAALEEQPDLTPKEALASVKDAIRYTFQYTEEHYTEGVSADVERLKTAGFELVELRNSWPSEEYKGINSRWRVPGGGQLFEVQFHTAISFAAKQLTHPAYERIRNLATPHAELPGLRAFQRKVNAEVPHPPGATGIPEHP